MNPAIVMFSYRLINAEKQSVGDRTIQAIGELYQQSGWWPDAGRFPEQIKKLIAGSHCFLIACKDREVVGMGRAISDGFSDAYIQDVVVAAAFRHQGIGSNIVTFLSDALAKDGIEWIGVIAENDSQPFYKRLGFKTMPAATPMLLKKK